MNLEPWFHILAKKHPYPSNHNKRLPVLKPRNARANFVDCVKDRATLLFERGGLLHVLGRVYRVLELKIEYYQLLQ